MKTQAKIQTHLSGSLAKFALLIEPYPWLSRFWDWHKKSCNIEALEKAMGGMSHGERILAQFFLSLWTRENHGFDMLEAASTLDCEECVMISAWLTEPFWP